MALTVRKNMPALAFGVETAFNQFVRSYVDLNTTYSHYDISSTPGGNYTAPTSTALSVANTGTADLAAVIVMAEAARRVLLVHFADAVAHKISDAVNIALITVATVPTATDQGTANTLLNALSTAFTAHEALTTVHSHADSTNAITAVTATTLANSKLLAADIRVQTNAHILLAWPSPSIYLVNG